jgi:enterochelin esterase-like enzyme
MTALSYPEVYGAAAVAGLDLRIHLRRDLYAALAAHSGAPTPRLRLEWSRYERGAPEDDADYPVEHAALVTALTDAGYRVEAGEVAGGPDWGTWRAGIPRLLRFLLRG